MGFSEPPPEEPIPEKELEPEPEVEPGEDDLGGFKIVRSEKTTKALRGASWSKDPSLHPMNMVTWYDSVKWCNARSEMEGRTPVYYEDVSKTTVFRKGEIDLNANMVRKSAQKLLCRKPALK